LPGRLLRFAAPGVSLVASLAFLLPLATAFAHPDLAFLFKLLAGALLVASVWRPREALLGLMVVLPFAAVLERTFAGQPGASAITDGLVLAFLSGASWRLAWPSSASPSRLLAPAVVLLAAVLTSAFHELVLLQRITPRVPIAPDVWRYLTTEFWTSALGYPVVHQAIRWASWLVLAVYAERIVAGASDKSHFTRAWIVAGVVGAILTLIYIAPMLARADDWVAAAHTLLQDGRITALQPDVNAAGSYFALFLLPALVLATRRRLWWMAGIVVPLLLFAFAATRSRAAFAGAVLAAAAGWALSRGQHHGDAPHRPRYARRIVLAVVGIVLLGSGLYLVTGRSNVAVGTALQYRLEMTAVGVEAVGRYPFFGVGLGDYIRTTRRYIDDEVPLLARTAPRGENAHNNLLQIAAELGVPALFAFLWLVVPIVAAAFDWRRTSSLELQGMGWGLAAFLVSALFGHPLLVSLVGAAFFIALGVTAALRPTGPPRSDVSTAVTVSVVAFYVASLFWRIT
jgi:O-antigen ligase